MVIKTSESIVKIASEIEAILKKQQYPGKNSLIPQHIKTFGDADVLWSKMKAQVTIIRHTGESMERDEE